MAAKLLTLWLLASAMVALVNADEDVDFLRAQLRERDVKIAHPTPQKPDKSLLSQHNEDVITTKLHTGAGAASYCTEAAYERGAAWSACPTLGDTHGGNMKVKIVGPADILTPAVATLCKSFILSKGCNNSFVKKACATQCISAVKKNLPGSMIKDTDFNYSADKATKIPKSSGPVTARDYGCATKFVIPGTNQCGYRMEGNRKIMADHCACTSCKKNHALVPMYHKAGTGLCAHYKPSGAMKCISPYKDSSYNQEGSSVSMCTRTVQFQVEYYYRGVKESPRSTAAGSIKRHFSPLDKFKGAGHDGNQHVAVSYCDVVKQTLCDRSYCRVKKWATCSKVCKMTKFSPLTGNPAACVSCTGKFGSSACNKAIMMA